MTGYPNLLAFVPFILTAAPAACADTPMIGQSICAPQPAPCPLPQRYKTFDVESVPRAIQGWPGPLAPPSLFLRQGDLILVIDPQSYRIRDILHLPQN